MKKISFFTMLTMLLFVSVMLLSACGEQTFDDVAYNSSEQSALSTIQSFNNAKTGMFNKTAEYETTDINITPGGTTKTVKISKFGRLNGIPFTQQRIITYSGESQSYVEITHYNNIIYTNTNGTVTSAAAGSAIDIPAFISSFVPTITDTTTAPNVTAVEEKNFEDVNYFRLSMEIGFINKERPQTGNKYIDQFQYEFGIHAQNNYLSMYRTTEVVVTDIPVVNPAPDQNYWQVASNRVVTTILKASGENVSVTIPVVS